MAVHGLDHINIVTSDLEGTKRFYKALLELEEGVPPPLPPGIEAHWLVDSTGHPLIHLKRAGPDKAVAGATGAIHHVALKCDDFATMRARCEELGVKHLVNTFQEAKFQQILVSDPNGVVLELNFAG